MLSENRLKHLASPPQALVENVTYIWEDNTYSLVISNRSYISTIDPRYKDQREFDQTNTDREVDLIKNRLIGSEQLKQRYLAELIKMNHTSTL